MKNASTAMQGHLQQSTTTLARLYKITRKDGTVLGYTDHDQDIIYGSYVGIATPSFTNFPFAAHGTAFVSNSLTLTAGHLAVVLFNMGGLPAGNVVSVTDGLGNVYTNLVGGNAVRSANPNFFTNYGDFFEIWYCENCRGGTTTVTVTVSASGSNNAGLYVTDYSGVQLSGSAIGYVAGKSGNQVGAGTVSVTTVATGSGTSNLIIAAIKNDGNNGTAWSYTDRYSSTPPTYAEIGDQGSVAAGGENVTMTLSGNAQWEAVAIVFKLQPGFGALTYAAAVGFSPTAIENKADLSVDNQEVTAFIDSNTIKETDLRFGVWDSADIEIRLCNWSDLTMGDVPLRKGILGNIGMKNGVMTAEILGLTNKLQIVQGRTFGGPCDAELGDARCQAIVSVENNSVSSSSDSHHITPNAGLTGAAGFYTNLTTGFFSVPNSSGVNQSGATGTGNISATATVMAIQTVVRSGAYTTYYFTLTSGPAPTVGASVVITGLLAGNNGTFIISTLTGTGIAIWTAGFYDDGFLTFTSGANSGLSYQIDRWDGKVLSLKNQLFVAPNPGDTFSISPGCAHNTSDCFSKFNNIANYQGFPFMPGQDSLLQYPDPTA